MAITSMLRASGLYTNPNFHSGVPEGSLFNAKNTVIDRPGIIESRRGVKVDAELDSQAKQLLTYKNSILVHYDNKLAFKSGGVYQDFTESITEVESGKRIKGIELNSNYYFTTNDGIKKITSLSAGAVEAAGIPPATDVTLSLDTSVTTGFLESGKEVAYRVLWGKKDSNDNLILGPASYRSVIYNPSTDQSRDVIISFVVPHGITTDHFYRVYRTASGVGVGSSGDEMKLVYEDISPSSVEGTQITVTDFQSEDLRDAGVALYSNEYSGDGQGPNNAPPLAKDVTIYKNHAFYSNTKSKHKLNVTLTGLDNLQGFDVTSVTGGNPATIVISDPDELFNLTASDYLAIAGINGTQDGIYLISSVSGTTSKTISVANPGTVLTTGTPSAQVFGSYIKINNDSSLQFFFVGRAEISTITVPAGSPVLNTNTDYFEIYSADDKVHYQVWFGVLDTDITGPSPITGATRLRVPLHITAEYPAAATTDDEIAARIVDALNSTTDFIAEYDTATNIITAVNITSGASTNISETLPVGWSVATTQEGFGGNVAKRFIKLSQDISASLAIEETAKSIVYTLNSTAAVPFFSFYISGFADLPGQMYFEAEEFTSTAFTIIAKHNISTIPSFNEDIRYLTTSKQEESLNKLYFSKQDQPEAVPITNSLLIGPKDKAILRIVGLRNSLFIFKEEGVYRLTGYNFQSFQVYLFDSSALMLAEDTIGIVNNQIFYLSTQGVTRLTETGVDNISMPIKNKIEDSTKPAFTTFKSKCFGIAYEKDYSYFLFMQENADDEYCTLAYRFNTLTSTWTNWDRTATCGVVEPSTDTLYLGPGDINAVEIERKTLTNVDYVDREYTKSLIGYNNGRLFLDSLTNLNDGDILEQTQTVSPYEFNKLVRDLNNELGSTITQVSQTQNLTTTMDTFCTELNGYLTNNNYIHLYFSGLGSWTIGGTIIMPGIISGASYITGEAIQIVSMTDGFTPFTTSITGIFYVRDLGSGYFSLHPTRQDAIDNTNAYTYGPQLPTSDIVFKNIFTMEGPTIEADYNFIIDQLNNSGMLVKDTFKYAEGGTAFTSIYNKSIALNTVSMKTDTIFWFGDIKHLESIKSEIVYAPMALNAPGTYKQFRRCDIELADTVLTSASVAFASDISGNFEGITYDENSLNGFGQGAFGASPFGGEGIGYPLKTLIPRQKQRCRYLKTRWTHNVGYEKYQILGVTYVYEANSEKGSR